MTYALNVPLSVSSPLGPWRYRAPSPVEFSLTAAATNDIFTINGSATTLVKVYRFGFSPLIGTSIVRAWAIVKRSVANTTQNSAACTAIPFDSSQPAATATVLNFTADPTTVGTAVGNVWEAEVQIPAATGTGSTGNPFMEICFAEPIILRGIAQSLGISYLGATPTAGKATAWVEWTEQL